MLESGRGPRRRWLDWVVRQYLKGIHDVTTAELVAKR